MSSNLLGITLFVLGFTASLIAPIAAASLFHRMRKYYPGLWERLGRPSFWPRAAHLRERSPASAFRDLARGAFEDIREDKLVRRLALTVEIAGWTMLIALLLLLVIEFAESLG
jgi:hypothetical protein